MSTFSTVRNLLDRIAADENVSPGLRAACDLSNRALRQEPVAVDENGYASAWGACFEALNKAVPSFWVHFGKEGDTTVQAAVATIKHLARRAEQSPSPPIEFDDEEEVGGLTQEDLDELQRDRDERNGDGPGRVIGR